ncbi:MAG: carboxymuconolactone decarboxylase family protein [Pseudomonadota bacterium]
MAQFSIHSAQTAPADARPALEGAQKAFGFVPNLYGVLAESPKVLEAYQMIGTLFEKTSLTPVERNIVWLEANYQNNCHYCVPAHTGLAKSQGVPDDVVEALREGTPINDPKLQALREFVAKVVVQRGELSEADTQAFLAAGYSTQTILDVILGVAQKTISNFTNHFADTPLDGVFKSAEWVHPKDRLAAE